MNDKRFIELLNLYVDQQLSADEASELEAELQGNPGRRSTYQEYCRMQKACTLLFESERQSAPASAKLARALADADRKIVAFPNNRGVWLHRSVFAGGVAALAACFALVFVHQMSPRQSVATQKIVPAAANEVVKVEGTQAVFPVQAVAIPPADPQTRSMRKFYAVMPVKQFIPLRVIAPASEKQAEGSPDFAWMKNVEIAPMRPIDAEDLLTDAENRMESSAEHFYVPTRPARSDVENTAFQYRKGN